LKEYGDKLSDSNKSNIEGALAELKTAHQSQDLAAIDVASEKLNAAWQASAQEMYAQGGEDQPGAAGGPTGNPGAGADNNGSTDDVTDVNFEEVK
jgi:molecular chaperone DnaK